ncbi:CAP domain-containing protein [Bifidobacterium sp. ESL0745]|uniref:CAP domain-containing protein n=1 Tax=Bifidobacterium sp. ESL0745 TaxID=2983226 RepID=UPI0023F9CCA9|nr:CAP domain-containing protein [Bifidobacterium sp. ESL0745]MDF7665044.1 CAP domain-containing protein [Bifidobacterium sp. ESL0745]
MRNALGKAAIWITAAATLLCGVAVNASAAEPTPQQAAQTALDAANKRVADLKPAADAAKAEEAKGTLGFFTENGSTEAVADVDGTTFGRTSWWKYVNLGQKGDATSLENLKASIAYIRKLNEIRTENHLATFKVDDFAMARTEVNADYDAVEFEHHNFLNAENIASGFNNPEEAFDMWYTQEKAVYDAAIAAGQTPNYSTTGHYQNIVNSRWVTTGFGLQTKGGYGYTGVNDFEDTATGKTYTVDEYEAKVDAYIGKINNAIAPYDQALKDQEAAQKALDKANADAAKPQQNDKQPTDDNSGKQTQNQQPTQPQNKDSAIHPTSADSHSDNATSNNPVSGNQVGNSTQRNTQTLAKTGVAVNLVIAIAFSAMLAGACLLCLNKIKR